MTTRTDIRCQTCKREPIKIMTIRSEAGTYVDSAPEIDAGIVRHISRLNARGYTTFTSCSAMPEDRHINLPAYFAYVTIISDSHLKHDLRRRIESAGWIYRDFDIPVPLDEYREYEKHASDEGREMYLSELIRDGVEASLDVRGLNQDDIEDAWDRLIDYCWRYGTIY